MAEMERMATFRSPGRWGFSTGKCFDLWLGAVFLDGRVEPGQQNEDENRHAGDGTRNEQEESRRFHLTLQATQESGEFVADRGGEEPTTHGEAHQAFWGELGD